MTIDLAFSCRNKGTSLMEVITSSCYSYSCCYCPLRKERNSNHSVVPLTWVDRIFNLRHIFFHLHLFLLSTDLLMDGLMNGKYDYQSYYHSTRHDPATEFTIPRSYSYHIPLGDRHVQLHKYRDLHKRSRQKKKRTALLCCARNDKRGAASQPGWWSDGI